MTVDYSSLDPLKTAASTATTDYASSVASAPSLLQELQKNLTTIFATDNPIINARNASLETFLNTPSQTRASLLTPNMPNVEGSPLTLSPTQQDAITTARTNASLVPLLGLNQAVTGIYGNIPQMVTNTGNLYTSLLTGEKAKADLARTAYEDAFKEITQKEQLRLQELSTMLSASGANTATGRAEAVLNQIAADAKAGLVLNDIMKKYSTSAYVSPADVLRIYNTNSIYGPAKETSQTLLKKYGVESTLPAEQQNRIAALQPAQNAIDQVKNLNINQSGPQNKFAQISIKVLGGLGVDQNLISLNQNFELLRQNVVRALQGARMSDQDIKIASNYVPSIIDTPDTVRTKLANLQSFLNSLSGQVDTMNTNNNSDWETVQ